jgi:hypothetical protein
VFLKKGMKDVVQENCGSADGGVVGFRAGFVFVER